ncbi:hypothetical protein LCGC14_2677770 [marine sediment metagenome]|uniref:Uncharacterized protein n=1 Tax=marine sediment metagenome TaxID=412755 RepID=A0A0F8ZM79_9ZZZZ
MATSHAGVQSIATIPSNVEEILRQTMVFGLPEDDALKPTFFFDREVTWADFDEEGKPWDWTATPVSDTTPASVQPICAVEFHAALGRSGAQFSEVGDFFPTTVIITFMEEDYLLARNSAYVVIGPEETRWWYRYWKPVLGLGGLSVYQAHFQAEDTE